MLCNTLRPGSSQNNMPSASSQGCPQFSELSSPRALSYTKLGILELSCGNSSLIFSVRALSIIDSSGTFGFHPQLLIRNIRSQDSRLPYGTQSKTLTPKTLKTEYHCSGTYPQISLCEEAQQDTLRLQCAKKGNISGKFTTYNRHPNLGTPLELAVWKPQSIYLSLKTIMQAITVLKTNSHNLCQKNQYHHISVITVCQCFMLGNNLCAFLWYWTI